MSNELSRTELSKVMTAANWAAIATAAATLLLLGLLHLLSPEYDPSWRMVSEYANGRYGWVLALMFACWGLSDWALIAGIWNQGRRPMFVVGLVFLFVAGAGTGGASVFDIKSPLHDVAATLGIPCLPIAAMLIVATLSSVPGWSRGKKPLWWLANLTWIAVVLFAANFEVTILSFHLAGRIGLSLW